MSIEKDEDLLAEIESLPRSLEPPADLWPGIEQRLTARDPGRVTHGWPAWARQAAAALAFMTLGGILSQVLLPGGLRGVDPGDEAAVDRGGEVVAGAEIDDDAAGPALAEAGSAFAEAGSSLAEADFALAEADYLRAKEALWGAVYSSRDAVSPATREVVERNLRVIDGAIRELRSALENDPGNPDLESLLLAQHQTEIDLLQRLARTVEI